MKNSIVITLLIGTLIPAWTPARAASLTDAGVPHTINLQSIVYDSSGNITKSDKVDVSVKILDADNNVVFSEDHNDVQVIEGAINVDIGSESGGVPLEVLDPTTGSKLIDVMIDGSNPFDIMPLGAVPYAMWAEKALTVSNDSIGTEQIRNGSIKAEDIDPLAFSDLQGQAAEGQLPDSVTMDTELNAHVTSPTAHPASAIVVSGPFINMVALNVQEGLQKLDVKLAEEMVNRQATTTALASHVAATTAHGSDGVVVGVNTLNTGLAAKVSKSGDTMTGNLTMSGGNIVMSGAETVDGVDVSNLQSQVDGHETRIAALENNPVDQNVRDFQMTFVVNSIGGDSSGNLTFGGADSAAWSVCDGNCDTDNDSWIYTDRTSIVVPSGCVAMASGTIAANPNAYETPASGGFRSDNSGYLRISYSDARTVNLRANAIGDDGYFEVNVRVIAFPVNSSTDCSVANWTY